MRKSKSAFLHDCADVFAVPEAPPPALVIASRLPARLLLRSPARRAPSFAVLPAMAGASNKKQKRADYRAARQQDGSAEMPKKKYYRQRAHANPFSDHQLE